MKSWKNFKATLKVPSTFPCTFLFKITPDSFKHHYTARRLDSLLFGIFGVSFFVYNFEVGDSLYHHISGTYFIDACSSSVKLKTFLLDRKAQFSSVFVKLFFLIVVVVAERRML